LPNGEQTVDLKNVRLAKVLAYLVRWSFVDGKGDPLPISREVLRSIDVDIFVEVMNAIDEHLEAIDLAASARKNAQGGETTSSAILPSLGITAGDTSGSENLTQTS
jgi:hypothetical protein